MNMLLSKVMTYPFLDGFGNLKEFYKSDKIFQKYSMVYTKGHVEGAFHMDSDIFSSGLS